MSNRVGGASTEAVRFHYDVGNDFYRLWLDPSMTYTCALFAEGETEEDLHAAQLRKIDYHIANAAAAGAARVLDVGCGWGAMLRRLVSRHGVSRAVGLTLSRAQADWLAQEPDPRVEARVESWTEHRPEAPYDAIVSIEAIEAFARLGLSSQEKIDVYRDLFARCHAWLRPGGGVALQAIVYGNSGPEDFDEFIATQIFPDSDLPSPAEIAAAIERRFEMLSLVNDREHYVRTLRAWLGRLRSRRDEAVGLVGEETVRRYEHYLRLCIYMFASGSCDLYRIALRRIDRPRIVKGTYMSYESYKSHP
jgi:cyclopropane-fatty-acyl-phospholipid synthase